ncbi:MAG: Gfo/Idh/MocA family oxidoreductase [Lachnospiraceae bacterium]|nr:Gfo/Idh/MocA family oxidoreductase [Lachnospiraceae bacterium]
MKIGAVGTSFIMDTILENMQAEEGMECTAIYSRKEETGRKLADRFGIRQVYTSLKELCADPTLDWIYIASPNSLHYEQAKTALLAGKHVLCEKPFTTTSAQIKELVEIARSKKLFLFEAILPLFHPHYQKIREYLPQIGNLKLILGTFCQYSSRYEALMAGNVPNVFNPEFAGGALMDLNLYNIYFTVGLFGKPESLQYYPTLFENGVDTNGILILKYPGFLAQCTGAKDAFCENSMQLLGDEGYIRVSPTASNCQEVKIVRRGKEELSFSTDTNPWAYEMRGLAELVKNQDYEECYRRLDTAIQVVEVLEEARKSAKMSF